MKTPIIEQAPATEAVLRECNRNVGDVGIGDLIKMHVHARKLEIGIREVIEKPDYTNPERMVWKLKQLLDR